MQANGDLELRPDIRLKVPIRLETVTRLITGLFRQSCLDWLKLSCEYHHVTTNTWHQHCHFGLPLRWN